MRVLLIGNFAPDRQESMLRFTQLLSGGIRERGHDVETWSPEPALVRWVPRYHYGGPAKYFGYVDKFVVFPRKVRARLPASRSDDVVHIVDHANAIYAPLFAGRPLLGTCHDLLQIRAAIGEFPQHRVSPLSRRYQGWILHHIRHLPHVACVSTETAADVRRLTDLPAERVSVIPNGLNFPYRPLPPPEARGALEALAKEHPQAPDLFAPGGRGFLINVGGGQWYKNRRGLLEIYAELRRLMNPVPRLVMVGKPLAHDLVAHVRRLGLGDDLVHIGGVSETQLQALYSLAEGLVFPSWHEGFGWPIAEAQACGCPVFTSGRAPMTEVGGDAAFYFDPADARAAAESIVAAWPQRSHLAARGLVRARAWDPQLMIERYLELYTALAGSRGRRIPA